MLNLKRHTTRWKTHSTETQLNSSFCPIENPFISLSLPHYSRHSVEPPETETLTQCLCSNKIHTCPSIAGELSWEMMKNTRASSSNEFCTVIVCCWLDTIRLWSSSSLRNVLRKPFNVQCDNRYINVTVEWINYDTIIRKMWECEKQNVYANLDVGCRLSQAEISN